MKKRICAFLLAAVMTASLSVSSFAAPIDMGLKMSLSSTVQEKKGIKSKNLTAKQLEELKKEESTIFDYPEVSTSYIDKKKMVLELDVVGQASAGLKKKLQDIQNKYGVDSKITIVEEYEWVDLPLVEEPKEPSAQDSEQIKKQEELKKWYQGLTEEQLSFVRSAIQEEEYLEEENRANEVDKLAAYLKKNLSKTQYTYISDEHTSVRIGIPSNKYREKIESLYRKYSKTNPNSVTVFYELCPLSLKELEKAMEELQKDSQLKKMMENNLSGLFINQSWIDLYWTNGVPKGFEEWLSSSQYQKLIYVRENQKPLLLDSTGL